MEDRDGRDDTPSSRLTAHWKRLRHEAGRLTRVDPSDLTQDAYVKFLKSSQGRREMESPSPRFGWLLSQALAWASAERHRRDHAGKRSKGKTQPLGEHHPFADDTPPSQRAEKNLRDDEIARAIDRLECRRDATVIRLIELQGLSVSEAAKILNLSYSHTKRIREGAIAKLRIILGPLGGEEK